MRYVIWVSQKIYLPINKKTPERAVFNFVLTINLFNGRYGQTFTAACTTTIQNFASRFSCHFFTKSVCFYTTCFRWLICSFCCHCFILLTANYLIICFLKTQLFYLVFTKPSFFRPSTNRYHTKTAANKFQNGKNTPDVFIFNYLWLLFLYLPAKNTLPMFSTMNGSWHLPCSILRKH